MITQIHVRPPHQGLFMITDEVEQQVRHSGIEQGLCTLFIQHSSASLIIQENADPSGQTDLEDFLSRLAPDSRTAYAHSA